jgi:hypothetical protein
MANKIRIDIILSIIKEIKRNKPNNEIVAPRVEIEFRIQCRSNICTYFRGAPWRPLKCIGKNVVLTPKKNKLKKACIAHLLYLNPLKVVQKRVTPMKIPNTAPILKT